MLDLQMQQNISRFQEIHSDDGLMKVELKSLNPRVDTVDSEFLRCQKCNIKIDRDLIGSRNIMIKSIQTV